MSRTRLFMLALPLVLVACSTLDERGTIAQLRNQQIEIEEEKIVGGLEKAMEGYQQFLRETPDTPLAPEAIRRLADLKVENEYGLITDRSAPADGVQALLPAPETARPAEIAQTVSAPAPGESEAEFERRTTTATATAATKTATAQAADDLERTGALEAIALYRKLLDEYPLYDRNDQVLYQMSRAYEELGRVDEAMEVMTRLVRTCPKSRYFDEVQFRRAEYFFTRRKYLDAEDAYKSIVDIGVASSFYQLALYKLGWTFYKQELYYNALDNFIALLDYQVKTGYDFEQTEDEPERKRVEDTFRVVSLSFSYLGGAEAMDEFFNEEGRRRYEDRVYGNLGEYYFGKRRYADATATYSAFVSRHPFHKMAPHFDMRVIEINMAGGFPTLVIDAKKAFATRYGLKSEYWRHFEPADYPEALGLLKTNLHDLANHYHALYQSPEQAEAKPANFAEALHWYREYLASFPQDEKSPAINMQLADLLLENRSFAEAAVEYEKIAYDYPHHEKSSMAGYAAVFARREHLVTVSDDRQEPVRREVVASSLKFAETFPEHEKAAIVLGAAADDLYAMQDYTPALAAAQKLIETFPAAEQDIVRAAWLVVGHASYELQHYSDAEQAYGKVLTMLPASDESRGELVDNLAAAIYKQGEEANAAEDYRGAADHFLRVGRMAPTSRIRPAAEFDAATALIQLKDWGAAATVLAGFRNSFPGHELQPEVTKKMAFVYREDGKAAQAAAEYERIETESDDDAIRQEALQVAAELYVEADKQAQALKVYRRYVANFPDPVALNLETRNKIADILKANGDRSGYLEQLRQIVALDAAGEGRTERTRYLAGNAALVLAENTYEMFRAIKLVKPLEESMPKKKRMMKETIKRFNGLIEYESGELTAAATFYLAEIYAHFSKALMASERPELTFDYYTIKPGDNLIRIARRSKCDISRLLNANNLKRSSVIVAGKKLKIPRGLYPEELEEYEWALEEQAYPFEERAISVHERNLQLMARGIYNEWIERSLRKLAEVVPARYARPEEPSPVLTSLDGYGFEIYRPLPVVAGPADGPSADTAPAGTVAPAVDAAQVGEEVRAADEEAMTAGKGQAVKENPSTVEEPQAGEEASSTAEVQSSAADGVTAADTAIQTTRSDVEVDVERN